MAACLGFTPQFGMLLPFVNMEDKQMEASYRQGCCSVYLMDLSCGEIMTVEATGLDSTMG